MAITGTLQWAISNASVGSFKYQEPRTDSFGKSYYLAISSEALVRDILLSFMERTGRWLSNDLYKKATAFSRDLNDEKNTQSCRDALSQQIHSLTGTKPRIVKEKNKDGVEQWEIYRV